MTSGRRHHRELRRSRRYRHGSPKGAQTPAHHLTHGTITGERGKPEDVAAMVRFLCGPGARHLTGQTLHVNNGAYLG